MTPLSELAILVLDCQATAAAPRGHLLEIGWSEAGASSSFPARAVLVRLPAGERVPPAVARVTGLTTAIAAQGVEAPDAWRGLRAAAAGLGAQPAPAIAHFARFEAGFLRAHAGHAPALDLLCTHRIARRLLPGLPRASLRALTGYFGRAVGALRRAAEHVEATAFVWRELVALLDEEGIETWEALGRWLAAPAPARGRVRRVWPMPREARLALPDAPGIYRLLRTSGDVLYVGKAASLRARVNSHFRRQHGIDERALEMLSQARDLSFQVAPSALEAALLEADEIKRRTPPYNIALSASRAIWFARHDLSARSETLSAGFPLGPFSSSETLDQFAALVRGDRAALGRYPPDAHVFETALARLRDAHHEVTAGPPDTHARWLRLGTRLWREGRRDRAAEGHDLVDDEAPRGAWSPAQVRDALERLALRAAIARRRARWITRLAESSIVWHERGAARARLIVIERGDVVEQTDVEPGSLPPVPPGHLRAPAERRAAFTLARFDRLRVLNTELKRLVADAAADAAPHVAPVAVRLGAGPPLSGVRLARVLAWV